LGHGAWLFHIRTDRKPDGVAAREIKRYVGNLAANFVAAGHGGHFLKVAVYNPSKGSRLAPRAHRRAVRGRCGAANAKSHPLRWLFALAANSLI
jgi:hypothetical protein